MKMNLLVRAILFSIAAMGYSLHSLAEKSLFVDKTSFDKAPKQNNQQTIKLMTMMPDMGTTISIAGAKLPWSTQFVLSGNQAQARRDNRCAFGFSYELTNSGTQSIVINSSKIMLDQKPLHLGRAIVLRMNDKKTISGTLYLGNGVNNLQFRLETANGPVEKTAAVLVNGC